MKEKTIGEKIREQRLKKGFTQDYLANELHVSSQAISKWETGQTMPDISLLMPLSRVLAISVNELLGGDRRRELEKRWHEAAELDEEMALLAIDDALTEFPDDEEFLYHRAKYEYVLGKRESDGGVRDSFLADASMHLEELVKHFPENDEYKNLLAHTYYEFGEKSRALQVAYSMKNGGDFIIEDFSEGDDKRRMRQRRMKNMTSGLLSQLKKYNTRESITAAYGLIETMMGDDLALRAPHYWNLCVSDALLCLEEGDLDRYTAKLTEAYKVAAAYDAQPWEKLDYKTPLFDLLSVNTCNRFPTELSKLIERFLSEPKLCHSASLALRRRIAEECFSYPILHAFRWRNYYRFCRKYVCKDNYYNFGTSWHISEADFRKKIDGIKSNPRRGHIAMNEMHKCEIEELVSTGVMSGYTAMFGDEIIGFCHCGRKESFELLPIPDVERKIPTAPEGAKVFSIVEIMIADAFKGCGVERELLLTALENAKKRGFTHAEVYPMEMSAWRGDEERSFYEMLALYPKLGFKVVRDLSSGRQGIYCIMQKDLMTTSKSDEKQVKDPIKVYKTTLKELEKQGYEIAHAMTDTEREEIENLYGIRFPCALREFFACGMPLGKETRSDFPLWRDQSEENVSIIKRRLSAPVENLKLCIKDGFWLEEWGERPKNEADVLTKFSEIAKKAPMLIPVYGHRYVPVIEGVDDPPVISVAGSDVIYYGSDLSAYLRHEFLGERDASDYERITKIPFWSDIIDQNW